MSENNLTFPITERPNPENLKLADFCAQLKTDPRYARIFALAEIFPEAEVCIVGGAVRDIILGKTPNDIDFIVRGVAVLDLEAYFRSAPGAKLNLVGRNFGVYKYQAPGSKEMIDIALPRTEQSTGTSRRDFAVQADPDLPITDDLSRRDFTLNAMAYNIKTQQLIDPYQGNVDLRQGVIKTVGDPQQRFDEDRTRMLRALRFACQFDFTLAADTEAVLKEMIGEINLLREVNKSGALVKERVVAYEAIGKEFFKSLNCAPKRTLELWTETGALQEIVPEIIPYLDDAAERLEKTTFETKLLIKLFLLFKDIGSIGINLAERLSARSTDHNFEIAEFKFLITWVDLKKLKALTLGQLEKQIPKVWQADLLQALTLVYSVEGVSPIADRLALIAAAGKPCVDGNDLKSLGLNGAQIREALNRIREAQLRGELATKEQALRLI